MNGMLELELELRLIPGVCGAILSTDPDGTWRVQILITDRRHERVAREEADRILERLDDWADLDVVVTGATTAQLAVERDIASLPGVESCSAARGARGEVRTIYVRALSDADLDLIRGVLDHHLGSHFPRERVRIEQVAARQLQIEETEDLRGLAASLGELLERFSDDMAAPTGPQPDPEPHAIEMPGLVLYEERVGT